MAKGTFIDENTPNKQVVLADMYHAASKYIHHTDVVILPSSYPFRPVRRLFRYGLVGKKSKIFGYEIDKSKAMEWFSDGDNSKSRKNIFTVEKRLKKAGYPASVDKMFKFRVGNVIDCPAAPFIDLDFCAPWFTTRKPEVSVNDPNSAINIMIKTIRKQQAAIPKTEHKAILGTVSLRGMPNGKHWSHACLGALVKAATGTNMLSIDGQTEKYGKGVKISTKGRLHKNGKTYHAYRHTVQIEDEQATAKLYTYTDNTPMLSFVIVYK